MGNFLSDLGMGVGMFGQALSKTIGDIHNIEALQTQKQQQALQNMQLQNAQIDLQKKQQEMRQQDQELPLSTFLGGLEKSAPKTYEYMKKSLVPLGKQNPLNPEDPLISNRTFGLVTNQLKQKEDFNMLSIKEHYNAIQNEVLELQNQKEKAKDPNEAMTIDNQIKSKNEELAKIAGTGYEFVQKMQLAKIAPEARMLALLEQQKQKSSDIEKKNISWGWVKGKSVFNPETKQWDLVNAVTQEVLPNMGTPEKIVQEEMKQTGQDKRTATTEAGRTTRSAGRLSKGTVDARTLEQINMERESEGKPRLTMEDFLTTVKKTPKKDLATQLKEMQEALGGGQPRQTAPPMPPKNNPPQLNGPIVEALPPANLFKGKRAFDVSKKKWLKSNGTNWVEE